MVIRYPPFMQRANVEPGSICHAFGTVMDIAPTILALAGVAHPNASPGHPREKAEYKGRQVYPMRGKSWLPYLLHGDKAPLASGSANGTSYSDDVLRREEEAEAIHGLLDPPVGWEMHGRASLRHGRFKIVNQPKTEFGTGEWQLYDLSVDQGEIHDLAEKMPEKLQELRGYFETYQEETGAVFGPPIRYETGMKSVSNLSFIARGDTAKMMERSLMCSKRGLWQVIRPRTCVCGCTWAWVSVQRDRRTELANSIRDWVLQSLQMVRLLYHGDRSSFHSHLPVL